MTRCFDFVETADRRGNWSGVQGVRRFVSHLVEFAENADSMVEGFARFGLGWFDHERFVNDEREVHCWWMDVVVQEAFGNVGGDATVSFFMRERSMTNSCMQVTS